ncbi:MAG: cysteine desulfurase family protein [Actinomycetota bacterium]
MPIYLDHAATTPIRPSVASWYAQNSALIGNPASVHSFGQQSRALLEEAREELAKVLGSDRNEVVFTSGGTESINLAIKGCFWNQRAKNPSRKLIISNSAEHHAVLESLEWLVREAGAEVYYLKLNPDGQISLLELEQLLNARGSEVALISLMWANNEIGNLNPIGEVVALAKAHSIPVHADAIAAFSHTPINFSQSGLSMLSITGHKVGAPVGIGALIISRDLEITPLQHGGSHERGLRSGTPDALAAKAFSLAATEAVAEIETKALEHLALTNRLIAGVRELFPEVSLSAEDSKRLPNLVHFRFSGLLGETLMFLLDQQGVAVSTGAACSAGVTEPSHVVLAIGGTEAEANSCIRISLGYGTTQNDIDVFLKALPAALEGARRAGLVGKR